LDVLNKLEQYEYSIYYVVEAEKLARPMNRTEYIYDVLNELTRQKNEFYFIFKRTLWFYELKANTDMYVDMMYCQLLADYLDGLLITTNMDMLTEEQNVNIIE
jgi:myosin-15